MPGDRDADCDAGWARFAVDVAVEAGATILSLSHGETTAGLKHGVEVVTDADLASDRLITARVAESFPDHRVLSEEQWEGWSDDLLDGPVWIVDPLDGSVNYARRHPVVAVSLALAVDGAVRVAAVHAPFLGHTFSAVRGGGSFLGSRRLQVAEPASLEEALVGTGFPHNRRDRAGAVARVERLVAACRDVRRSGSPALDICWVAAGILDAHTESLAPWDVAASGLVATEAGAMRTNLETDTIPWPADLAGAGIVIASPTIFDALCELLSTSPVPTREADTLHDRR